MKRIKVIFLIIISISIFLPYKVCAESNNLEIENNKIIGETNDNTGIYLVGIEESILLNYNEKKINNVLLLYINNKINNESINVEIIDIKNNIAEYKLSTNQDNYNSSIEYKLSNEITIDYKESDNKIELIKEYFANVLKCDKNLIDVSLDNNSYLVKYNEIENKYNIIFNAISNNNSINNTEIPQIIAENNQNIETVPSVGYQTHIQDVGWQSIKKDGQISGTEGYSLRLEGIKIKLENSSLAGSILYQTHIQYVGWQDWKQNGQLSGTEGLALRLEAIRIMLTGDLANEYDIYYRVHIQDYGWLGWAKNGESSGSEGYGYRLEAIEIKIVKKGETIEKEGISFIEPIPTINSESHIQDIGWTGVKNNQNTIGTTGYGLRMEAVKLSVSSSSTTGGIEYTTYIKNKGWQNTSSNGNISGTVGEGKEIEAIKINLTGDLANNYDIYYRVHISDIGWLGWTKNGQQAGAIGYFTKIEAIQIKIVYKGQSFETGGNAILEKEYNINYSSHVATIGWQNSVKAEELSGTTGVGLSVEAVKISISSSYTGNIMYQTYINKTGWQDWVYDNNISGTIGLGKKIESLRIKLTGDLAEHYDIWYRVYVSNVGWMGWTCNGNKAGTDDINQGIEGYEIVVLPKGMSAPGTTANSYATGHWDGDHYYDAWGQMANDFKVIDGVKYFFNSLGVLIGSNVKKVIDVSANNKGTIDWETVKRTGDVDAVILRVASYSSSVDEKFTYNVSELNRLGIPYGIYLYSYAENQIGTVSDLGTMHEGSLDAMRIIKAIKDYNVNLSLPIYYDLEKWDNSDKNADWGINEYRPIVEAFDKIMVENGYNNSWAIYASKYWAENRLYEWSNRITWIAQYNHYCNYNGSYTMWQYSSTEQIAGISGNVDASVLFA